MIIIFNKNIRVFIKNIHFFLAQTIIVFTIFFLIGVNFYSMNYNNVNKKKPFFFVKNNYMIKK